MWLTAGEGRLLRATLLALLSLHFCAHPTACAGFGAANRLLPAAAASHLSRFQLFSLLWTIARFSSVSRPPLLRGTRWSMLE